MKKRKQKLLVKKRKTEKIDCKCCECPYFDGKAGCTKRKRPPDIIGGKWE